MMTMSTTSYGRGGYNKVVGPPEVDDSIPVHTSYLTLEKMLTTAAYMADQSRTMHDSRYVIIEPRNCLFTYNGRDTSEDGTEVTYEPGTLLTCSTNTETMATNAATIAKMMEFWNLSQIANSIAVRGPVRPVTVCTRETIKAVRESESVTELIVCLRGTMVTDVWAM